MSKSSLHLFLSYSHKDDVFRQELSAQLSPLRHLGLIVEWTDRLISAGLEWDKEIDNQLDKADLILLLISADFINSSYCFGVELGRALSRHAKGTARVIPIIARPCRWEGLPFAKLHALPLDSKPISLWDNRDTAYLSVVQGVENVARDLLANDNGLVTEWTTSLLYRRKVCREVQNFLKACGLYNGAVDGEPANVHLRDAVRRFQQQVGIRADGLIGPQTLRAIASMVNRDRERE